MKTGNEIIAEYMGCPYIVDGTLRYWLVDGRQTSTLRYDISIEWIYPVYLKLRKELKEKADFLIDYDYHKCYNRRSAIEVALIQGDIHELHTEIVKGITFLNEQKK